MDTSAGKWGPFRSRIFFSKLIRSMSGWNHKKLPKPVVKLNIIFAYKSPAICLQLSDLSYAWFTASDSIVHRRHLFPALYILVIYNTFPALGYSRLHYKGDRSLPMSKGSSNEIVFVQFHIQLFNNYKCLLLVGLGLETARETILIAWEINVIYTSHRHSDFFPL